jgi:hypothetical protein
MGLGMLRARIFPIQPVKRRRSSSGFRASLNVRVTLFASTTGEGPIPMGREDARETPRESAQRARRETDGHASTSCISLDQTTVSRTPPRTRFGRARRVGPVRSRHAEAPPS